jgi:hypothetical protein
LWGGARGGGGSIRDGIGSSPEKQADQAQDETRGRAGVARFNALDFGEGGAGQAPTQRRIETFSAGGKETFLDEAMAAHQDRPACGSGLLQAAGEPALYPGDVLAQGKKAFLRRGGGRHDGALSRFVLVTFS